MSAHALLSASSAHRWMACPGSIALCKDLPNKSSSFADEGTAAHEFAAWVLEENIDLESQYESGGKASNGVTITDEMVDNVKKYVQLVKDFTAGGTLLVEKRVDYSDYIGVPNSFGTSDTVIISPDGEEVTIIDLKYGRGVRVDADNNPQLMLYALGTINELSVVYDNVKRVRMVIHQPRLDHISEWDCSIEELMAFAELAKIAADVAISCIEYEDGACLVPGEKQCQWCLAKATCPALSKFVQDTIGAEFTDLTKDDMADLSADASLSAKMKAIPLIEDFCKAVRAKVESELFAGNSVDGFKLVQGRQGARAWTDVVAVEDLMKRMRLKKDEMYDLSLISPTSAEKLFKKNLRQWDKFEEMIVRKDGKPSVAPVSDKRSAMQANAVDFEDLTGDGVV